METALGIAEKEIQIICNVKRESPSFLRLDSTFLRPSKNTI